MSKTKKHGKIREIKKEFYKKPLPIVPTTIIRLSFAILRAKFIFYKLKTKLQKNK
jgi:hypothetical protein